MKFFFCALLCVSFLEARILSFLPGQAARHTVHETYHFSEKNNDLQIQGKSKYVFDTRIVEAINDELLIELVIDTLDCNENGKNVGIYYQSLLHVPFLFKVNGNGVVEDVDLAMTDAFFDLEEDPAANVSDSTFIDFVDRLVHLKGQDLEKGSIYPISGAHFVDWMDDETCHTDQCSYTMTNDHQALFQGHIEGGSSYSELQLSINGNVTWNTENSLVQKRENKYVISYSDSDDGIDAQGTLFQKWISIPLSN